MPSRFDTYRYRCRDLRRSCAGIKLMGRGIKSESEGVFTVFEYFQFIVFQLVERIAITEKSIKSVLRKCSCVLGFSYNAIPTRHEVHGKPYLQEV